MRAFISETIIMMILISNILPAEADEYDAIVNCGDYLSDKEGKYPDLMSNSYYKASTIEECNVSKGHLSENYKNISSARYNLGNFYDSIGEEEKAKVFYQSSIFALKINNNWKNKSWCSSAAMSAAKLSNLHSISQDDRSEYAHKSAIHGNQIGGINYAKFLENGEGVRKDFILAYAWYNIVSSYNEGSKSKEAKAAMQRMEGFLPMQSQLDGQSLSRKIEDENNSIQDCGHFIEMK